MAALWSVASAIVLVSLKIFLTIRTGSLGVLSEALHSGLDLIAALITYLSVGLSDRPADEKHPYGHGKLETFSAFVETALLLLTAVYIIWEAFGRLFLRNVHLTPSLTAIFILSCCLSIDIVRARALGKAARKYSSEALEADALHFSTDVWSTLVVIAGVTALWLSDRWGLPWLRYADPLAALAVSGVIIWVGVRLGKKTVDGLLDAAPVGLQRRISEAVNNMNGVLNTQRVRVRRAGNRHFVDVTIDVPRTATFEQVHALSDAVERRIGEITPSDVMVHMEPRAPAGEHLFEAIRAIAQKRGLAVHDLSAHQLEGRVFVELHLEVDEQLSLREAHRRASELEDEIRKLPGGEAQVYIHIEPLGHYIAPAAEIGIEMKALERAVESFINSLQPEYPEFVDCHEVRVRQVEHHILVSCHCAMNGNLPITQIHDVTGLLEARVKEQFPQIYRVTIHPEPVEES
ncbi:MAG TPA: cation-efflux pump [Candidatus Dormibacteraeota bacterium]|nr:cation-efflux pump [Candidatus Dormibacteraeota bacterium]